MCVDVIVIFNLFPSYSDQLKLNTGKECRGGSNWICYTLQIHEYISDTHL